MIYADNSATTKVLPEVLDAMLPFFKGEYGNPSSLYEFAYTSARAVEKARAQVADVIGAKPREIYFTSCGSESDNWVLKGVASRLGNKGRHIITSALEHPAIMHTCEYLEKKGFRVTYIKPDKYGMITAQAVEDAIEDDTILISVMTANNEIGTIMPIKEIGEAAKKHGILFHTDAVQAFGHIPMNVDEMNIDLLSMSGHKIGAPKGIGALYMRTGVNIDNLIHGGGQEKGRRAGTENVPYIVGLGRACEHAAANMECNIKKLTGMRDRLIERVLKIPYVKLTGHPTQRLPGLVSIIIEGVEGEALLLNMYNEGICASSGSACSSGSLDPSHVLLGIGLPHHIAHGSLRLSLGEINEEGDEIKIAEAVEKVAAKLRAMSPVWEDGKPVWEKA